MLRRIVYADEVTLLQQLQQEIEYHYKAGAQGRFVAAAMVSPEQPGPDGQDTGTPDPL